MEPAAILFGLVRTESETLSSEPRCPGAYGAHHAQTVAPTAAQVSISHAKHEMAVTRALVCQSLLRGVPTITALDPAEPYGHLAQE